MTADEFAHNPTMTADEFEQAYARRSGMTVASLRTHGRIVRPCDCGDDMCEGWQSISTERAAELDQRACAPPVEEEEDELIALSPEDDEAVRRLEEYVSRRKHQDCPRPSPVETTMTEARVRLIEEYVSLYELVRDYLAHFRLYLANLPGLIAAINRMAPEQRLATIGMLQRRVLEPQPEPRCPWCNTDPKQAAEQHEGPHATWCPYGQQLAKCQPPTKPT